jgi:DDE family transposase
VSQAGAVLLLDAVGAAGLDRALRAALEPWRKPTAVHDPAKIVLDVAVALALGGDCLADVAVLRGAPAVFGRVASDPTVSRLIKVLAANADRALGAIEAARAAARGVVWRRAGVHAPDHDVDHRRPLAVDVDATLVAAHSEKEAAAPTFKRGFGHHPLTAFVDHGKAGTGEPVAMLLRRGNAGSNTAADHITVIRSALKQLPADNQQGHRSGRSVLIRIDGPGRPTNCSTGSPPGSCRTRSASGSPITPPTCSHASQRPRGRRRWTPRARSAKAPGSPS